LERHQELIEANMQAISALRENRSVPLWLDVDAQSAENEYIRLHRGKEGGRAAVYWTIKPGWVGAFQIIAGTEIVDSAYNERIYMRELQVPNPQFPWFGRESIGSVLCTIIIKPGAAKTETLPIPDQTI